MEIELYRKSIYEKVCKHCIDLGKDGKCTLTDEMKCGVEMYLPEIVKVVQSVKSPYISDYIKKLRDLVCTHCANQNADGTCNFRLAADCGLDRYFLLIVEAIEEVDRSRPKPA